MKSLAICSTLLASTALAKVDGWQGVWKLTPVSTSAKCCFFDEIVSIRDFVGDKVWVEGYYANTQGCKDIHSEGSSYLYDLPSENTLTFQASTKFVDGTITKKDGTADLVSKVGTSDPKEECKATLTLDNSLIKWDGLYTVDTIADGCCKPKSFTLKTVEGKINAEGSWDDSDACKKLDQIGEFIHLNAGSKTNEVFWNYPVKDTDGSNYLSKIELRKWSSKLEFSYSQGFSKSCKGTVTVSALPKEKPKDDKGNGGGNGWIVPVVIVIIVILIALAVGGYFWYRKRQAEKLKGVLVYNGMQA